MTSRAWWKSLCRGSFDNHAFPWIIPVFYFLPGNLPRNSAAYCGGVAGYYFRTISASHSRPGSHVSVWARLEPELVRSSCQTRHISRVFNSCIQIWSQHDSKSGLRITRNDIIETGGGRAIMWFKDPIQGNLLKGKWMYCMCNSQPTEKFAFG